MQYLMFVKMKNIFEYEYFEIKDKSFWLLTTNAATLGLQKKKSVSRYALPRRTTVRNIILQRVINIDERGRIRKIVTNYKTSRAILIYIFFLLLPRTMMLQPYFSISAQNMRLHPEPTFGNNYPPYCLKKKSVSRGSMTRNRLSQ